MGVAYVLLLSQFGSIVPRGKTTMGKKNRNPMYSGSDRRSFFWNMAAMAAGATLTSSVSPARPSSDGVPVLSATLDDATWSRRLITLHQQLYASNEFGFDNIMTCVYRPPMGYVLADHSIVRGENEWHLFYVTGEIRYADEWIAAIRAGNFKYAQEVPYEVGDGHAVGPSLNHLEFKGLLLDKPQGDFGLGAQDGSHVNRIGDEYLDIYTSRGPDGQALCLARSRDLEHWEMDPSNPFWRPPAYAMPRGVCKSAHTIRHPVDPYYLIYYNLSLSEGATCVALLSTQDFKVFHDHGPVLKMTLQLRGTSGCESPCVVYRDGIWHLFFGCGTGMWHAVSNRPDNFMGAQGFRTVSAGGCYMLGPYHAAVMFQYGARWFLSTTRKEYQRRLNREAGVLKFRGSAADESSLLAGLFLCGVEWKGDQPLLRKLDLQEIP